VAHVSGDNAGFVLGRAIGLDANRMRVTLNQAPAREDCHRYHAVWDRERGLRFVSIALSPGHLWGNHFDVHMFNEQGNVIAAGSVDSEFEHEYPYALVELKTSSKRLPASYRGRWILGIAFASTEIRFDASRPTRIVSKLCLGKGEYNMIRVEPVQWSDWPKGFSLPPGQLAQDSDVQYRWAESALSHGAIDY
jgi:hypothetical protein